MARLIGCLCGVCVECSGLGRAAAAVSGLGLCHWEIELCLPAYLALNLNELEIAMPNCAKLGGITALVQGCQITSQATHALVSPSDGRWQLVCGHWTKNLHTRRDGLPPPANKLTTGLPTTGLRGCCCGDRRLLGFGVPIQWVTV